VNCFLRCNIVHEVNESLVQCFAQCVLFRSFASGSLCRRFLFSRLLRFPSRTGCPGRNVPDFGRVFLMVKYTDITQNIHIQSWTVTEIMAREVWNFDSCYTLVDYQIHIKAGRNMWFL
jgi:hypothetical protein